MKTAVSIRYCEGSVECPVPKITCTTAELESRYAVNHGGVETWAVQVAGKGLGLLQRRVYVRTVGMGITGREVAKVQWRAGPEDTWSDTKRRTVLADMWRKAGCP